jgi:periplasmic protein TonB
MHNNIDINSNEWCDIVFEGKNKAYGAYALRHRSFNRHRYAIILVTIIFLLALFVPGFIKIVMPKNKERMVEVTSLSDLKMEQAKPKENLITAPPPPPLKSSIKFTPPVIKPDEEVAADDEIKTQEELNETKVTISVADVKGTDEENGVDVAELNQNQEIAQEPVEEEVFLIVEQMPEFPGGETALRTYIAKNIKYPATAQEMGIQGKVYVTFIVDSNGNVTKATIARGIDASLDKEALRVINTLPKWTPGKQRGKPVSVSYTVPINFTLN